LTDALASICWIGTTGAEHAENGLTGAAIALGSPPAHPIPLPAHGAAPSADA